MRHTVLLCRALIPIHMRLAPVCLYTRTPISTDQCIRNRFSQTYQCTRNRFSQTYQCTCNRFSQTYQYIYHRFSLVLDQYVVDNRFSHTHPHGTRSRFPHTNRCVCTQLFHGVTK